MAIEYGLRKTFTDYIDDVGIYASPQYLLMENEDAANLSTEVTHASKLYRSNPVLILPHGLEIPTETEPMKTYGTIGIISLDSVPSYKIYTKPKVCQY